MSEDELIYFMQNPVDTKLDLLNQLRELKKTGVDPELEQDIRDRLDRLCGVECRLNMLSRHMRNVLNSVYVMPGAFGKAWKLKPTASDQKDAPQAVKALLEIIESAKWNGCCFHYWNLRHEKMMRQIYAEIPNPTPDRIKYFNELFDTFNQSPSKI